jgi:uncharacterized protein (TIGR03437 family)
MGSVDLRVWHSATQPGASVLEVLSLARQLDCKGHRAIDMTRRVSIAMVAFSLHAAHLVYQTNLSASLVVADSAGNAYILGNSQIAKLDPSGNVIYSKALPALGVQAAIAVDAAGNVLIAGNTNADSLPTTPGVFQQKRSPGVCITGDKSAQPYPCPDAFVAKIDPNGNLSWATYLGGLNIDQANAIAVDPEGNAYVTGFTLSSDFPIANAFQSQFGGYADAFVAKISSDGTKLLYSSFLGGDGYDVAHAIAVDAAGSAYVAGEIEGTLPVFTAGFSASCSANSTNGFLIKVSPGGGQLTVAGCLGGSAITYSEATAVAVDSQDNIYVGGDTNSASFVSTTGSFYNVSHPPYFDFIAKILADGSALAYSTLFTGAPFGVTGLAVDSSGDAYLSGPAPAVLPITRPAIQPCPGSDFLLQLNPAGSAPIYSSFSESPTFALTSDGSVILAGSSVNRLAALATPSDSFLSQQCVLNGANFESHLDYGQPGISPGEIVTLQGTGLGPMTPSNPVATNAVLGTMLGGTQVLFDGVAAPLMYVQDAQINVLAPYGLAGKTSVTIQVQYQGQSTAPVTIPVSAHSAALFQPTGSAPIVLNQDYSQNSQTNPASRGSILILYMTGAGQTSPPSIDGQVWQTAGGLQTTVSAQLTSFGTAGEVIAPLPVIYAGPAPTLVSGVQQVNLQIPRNLPDYFVTQAIGPASSVTLQVGTQQLSLPVYVQ